MGNKGCLMPSCHHVAESLSKSWDQQCRDRQGKIIDRQIIDGQMIGR